MKATTYHEVLLNISVGYFKLLHDQSITSHLDSENRIIKGDSHIFKGVAIYQLFKSAIKWKKKNKIELKRSDKYLFKTSHYNV